MNVGGTPIQQLWGVLEPKLSYQVLESCLKCNQGAKFVHYSGTHM